MLNPSFEELRASGKLPSPPGIGMEVLRLTRERRALSDELLEVLQGNPALVGRLLHLANAGGHGEGGPTCTLSGAAERLGAQEVRQVALGFTLVSGLHSGPCPSFDYDRYWSECVVRALVCRELAAHLRLGDEQEAFFCGLLSQVGTLALATVHPKQFDEILRATDKSAYEERRRAERAAFGIDNLEVTAALLQNWGLPKAWQDAARRVGSNLHTLPPLDTDMGGLPELVWVGARFGAAFSLGEDRPYAFDEVQGVLARFQRWDLERLPDLWEQVREEGRRWARRLELQVREVPFYLSAPETEELGAGQGGETAEESAPGRVLVVDDDPMSLRMVAHTCERAGLIVTTATDGREALRLALEEPPDVLIADWMMPEMTGLELCEALRETEVGRKMYIVLLTSKSEEDQVVRAFDSGVDDHVVKPFKPKLLLARVRAGQRVVRLQKQVDQDQQVMRQQVAELGVLTRKLLQASLTDPLTELPNRRWAMGTLERQWNEALERGEMLAAIGVDIDHFKAVNDTWGHDVGDVVLRETGRVLRQTLGEEFPVARMGGEEFLVLLARRHVQEARALAEMLRRAVAEMRVVCGDFAEVLTASFGVAAIRPTPGQRPDELLKAADRALYAAKAAGRNRVCMPAESSRTAD